MGTIVGALLIGLALGLLGSGGSVVTVPVLVYVLGHNSKVAVAESLVIVGAIALAGAVPYGWSRQIDWRSVVLFGLPGMAGTYGGAWLARYVSGPVQLVLFACVMLLAAWMMFRQSARPETKAKSASSPSVEGERHRHPAWKIAIEGVAVGVLTGLVGVGGGFLIVPALVLLGGLPMRLAVGTSLLVVAAKSLAGFAKYQHVLKELNLAVDWQTIGWFVAVGVLGTLTGARLATRLNQRILQRIFVVFLIVMGCFVLGQELPGVFLAGPVGEAK